MTNLRPMNNVYRQPTRTLVRPRENNQLVQILLWVAFFFILFIVVWQLSAPEEKAYNKHMCAVYGYREDCATPLTPAERLK